ncbi:hypothetical protein VTK73DRAFT_2643 [Phialemonium thermophilum]|uniref:EamA domain-containing protein n=1 Tax=Phialemonium thermophilum TaxID=223376 RepID=A0ABR3X401_9PEZI
MALLGVLGGAIAFVCIRWIGRRAHPLVSVNYFSTCCTVVSTTVLFLAPLLNVGQPEIHFALPVSGRQWLLLVSLGISGFIMQFMVTAGLGGEKSNRATTMAYTQMLFAAVFDKWVFGHAMSTMSLIGCGFILGSALWVAVTKKEEQDTTARPQADVEAGRIMEGIPMLEEERRDREEEQDSSEESIPLQQFR